MQMRVECRREMGKFYIDNVTQRFLNDEKDIV